MFYMQPPKLPLQQLLLLILLAADSSARIVAQGGAKVLARRKLQDAAGATVTKTTEDYVSKVLQRYLSNNELAAAMKDFAVRCSAIAKLSSIGQSVNGVPLWVLEISDKPGQKEAEPNFKYIGNMHGNEASPRQMLLAFAEWLCANYKTDPKAARVVKDMHVYIMPTMNPDGYALGQRENADGMDLNRNFPDPILDGSLEPTPTTPPEVKAVIGWSLSKRFTSSANFHEGVFVVNYPWDGNVMGRAAYNATQDDLTMRYLARVYASQNPRMNSSVEFPGGITNGAAWYVVYGGMQDWNYAAVDCLEMTIEVWGPASQMGNAPLQTVWEQNKESLLDYALTTALGGVRGRVRVRDSAGKLRAAAAQITVSPSNAVTRSLKQRLGFYSVPLKPGQYTVRYSVKGYPPQEHIVTVAEGGAGVVKNVVFE